VSSIQQVGVALLFHAAFLELFSATAGAGIIPAELLSTALAWLRRFGLTPEQTEERWLGNLVSRWLDHIRSVVPARIKIILVLAKVLPNPISPNFRLTPIAF
jgi:hypothetical protein